MSARKSYWILHSSKSKILSRKLIKYFFFYLYNSLCTSFYLFDIIRDDLNSRFFESFSRYDFSFVKSLHLSNRCSICYFRYTYSKIKFFMNGLSNNINCKSFFLCYFAYHYIIRFQYRIDE